MNETLYIVSTAFIGAVTALGSWGVLVASVFGVEM